MKGYCYIATPYTRFGGGIEAAFEASCRAAAILIKRGIPAFSPIAHSHPIAKAGNIDPLALPLWLAADKPLMEAASALLVVKLDGWADSLGVAHEIKAFHAMYKPVVYATEEELQDSDFKAWFEQRLARCQSERA